ncbi:MAG: class I SAM-dependent methyltransferase [Chlorobiales bacterium]|nr:class I SAM-dependent methyltransferase [Chlorobiales bacterium]
MSDRKAHWEQVYAGKSPEQVSWYQKVPELSLWLIHHTGVSHASPIIDIGGGASTLAETLLDEGYERLAVLDISSKALSHAQERLGERAGHVEWIAADVTEFGASQPFMIWHDRAVFHFLTDASDRRKYVDVLRQSLAPGGHLILAAFAIGGPTKCSGLDIVQYDSEKLLGELGNGFLLVEETLEVHLTPAGKEQQFAYFRLVRQD